MNNDFFPNCPEDHDCTMNAPSAYCPDHSYVIIFGNVMQMMGGAQDCLVL